MDRFARAASVMIGAISRARSVRLPSTMSTGIAAKAQPLPREEVMTMTMTKSRMDFVTSTELSPLRPSWMAPTTAMAPMLTVREAVTKASTKVLSFALPVLRLSHWPKRSKPPSMLSHSPMSAPTAAQSTSSRLRPLTRAAPCTLSILLRTPAMPMKMTVTPQVFINVS